MSEALETERVILRPPGRQDLDSIVRLLGDFAVSKNLARAPHPYTEKDGRGVLLFAANGWVRGEDFIFAILRKDGAGLVGLCGIHPSRDWELGYWIGRPFWGQGYATEAAAAVIDFAFARGTKRIKGEWFHDNPASGHVLSKLGFVPAGEGLSNCAARGHKVPSYVMALDRAVRGTKLAA